MLERLESLDNNQRFKLVNHYLRDSKALVLVSPLYRTEEMDYCDSITPYELLDAINSGTFRQYDTFCYINEDHDLYSIDDPFEYVDAETIFYYYEECLDQLEKLLDEVEKMEF